MIDEPQIKIVVTRRLAKYAEGVDPRNGTPFEIIDVEETLEGKRAEEALRQLTGEGGFRDGSDKCRS